MIPNTRLGILQSNPIQSILRANVCRSLSQSSALLGIEQRNTLKLTPLNGLQVTTGMWDFGLQYYERNFTAAQQAFARRNDFLKTLPSATERIKGMVESIHNSFEVVHVPRFLRDDIQRFHAAVDASNNMYRYR